MRNFSFQFFEEPKPVGRPVDLSHLYEHRCTQGKGEGVTLDPLLFKFLFKKSFKKDDKTKKIKLKIKSRKTP